MGANKLCRGDAEAAFKAANQMALIEQANGAGDVRSGQARAEHLPCGIHTDSVEVGVQRQAISGAE